MFKSYWLAVVLAGVTGLSVMTDAQSTVDDEMASCAGLLDVVSVVETLASNHQLIASQANETRLAEIEKVVKESKDEMKAEIARVKNETNRVLDVLENAIKTIALNQQKTADELREVKRLLASNQSACECVNSTCPSPAAPVVVVNSTDCVTMSITVSPPESSSKQALVSALVCEYRCLLSVKHYSTDSTLVSGHLPAVGPTQLLSSRGGYCCHTVGDIKSGFS